MKDKHINDLFNAFSPPRLQMDDIYDSINKASGSKNKHRMTAFPTRNVLVAISCFVIITIVAIPLINNTKTENIVLNDTKLINTVPKSNKSEFSGFVMTAYAAEKKDTYLSTNYKEENIATIMTPNVELLLSNFSPLISSVPGLPFTFNFNPSESTSVIADEMIITVDNGEFCSWNVETGIVTSEGTAVSCNAGDTLYWSPLIPLNGNEKAQITVIAMKNGKELGKQIISIATVDNNYYAKIGTLII